MRRPRPAGERFRVASRFDSRAAARPERARITQAAPSPLTLASADIDSLRVLWGRRGGSVIEMSDGTLAVLAPNGERITRGTPAHVEDQLRLRLARVDLWPLLVA